MYVSRSWRIKTFIRTFYHTTNITNSTTLLLRLVRVLLLRELISDAHQGLAEKVQPPPLLGVPGFLPPEPDPPYLRRET